MKDVLLRLKSPVVITQIIGTIVGVLIYFMPDQSQDIQIVTAAVVAIINLLAGLNNPTNPSGF